MDHAAILDGVASQLDGIFETSEQPIYLYLDDTHKICNELFASLLGYDSAEEWAAVDENFPTVFVGTESRNTLISAYQTAMQEAIASSIEVEWMKRDGGTVQTEVILVPIEYAGHRMALHFVTESS
ncbi:PAS domain-containing protein [Haladaptatus sp. CMSO5]|uniref:PAS domain-containing protein n=1 Tax=Haladaptatus sp. CMSO5 TaxID=3120514 RepID=UPI002FCE13DE